MNSSLSATLLVRVLFWNSNRVAKVVLELFWGFWSCPGASWSCSELPNRCPSYNHHKDLESPEMGQLEHDYIRLLKRQESSFLLTLIVLIGGAIARQDL